MNKYIENFSYCAINIIIYDIMELDIIVPRLVFDYSKNVNIKNGYYMYQNISGDIITLNMNNILLLRYIDDIKTVITYSFIHEIMHMYQAIYSKYKTNKQFYTMVEDTADINTINFINSNKSLIENRLNFEFNDVFLKGIERQLSYNNYDISFENHSYYSKIIAGTLSSKLDLDFDYLYNSLMNANMLKVIFPNKREYNLDLLYANINELNILINLIHLADFKMIHIKFEEFIYGSEKALLVFNLY